MYNIIDIDLEEYDDYDYLVEEIRKAYYHRLCEENSNEKERKML